MPGYICARGVTWGSPQDTVNLKVEKLNPWEQNTFAHSSTEQCETNSPNMRIIIIYIWDTFWSRIILCCLFQKLHAVLAGYIITVVVVVLLHREPEKQNDKTSKISLNGTQKVANRNRWQQETFWMAFMAESSSCSLACVKALSKWVTEDSKFPSLTDVKK